MSSGGCQPSNLRYVQRPLLNGGALLVELISILFGVIHADLYSILLIFILFRDIRAGLYFDKVRSLPYNALPCVFKRERDRVIFNIYIYYMIHYILVYLYFSRYFKHILYNILRSIASVLGDLHHQELDRA